MTAQLAVSSALYHPGPVVAVDAAASLWPGLARRLPLRQAGREVDWCQLWRLLDAGDGVAVVRSMLHETRHVEFGRSLPGRQSWITRLGGSAHPQPFATISPDELLRVLHLSAQACRVTFVDCAADMHVLTRVCATVADVLVVVCRADADELRRCACLVELLAVDTRTDLSSKAVIVPVQHRPGKWPHAAAAAEAAAGDAVAGVMRMPYDSRLARSCHSVMGSRTARHTATQLAATVALLARQSHWRSV
ncbi:hypothetical protein ACQPZF_36390 [Actinosynnema sp. CS-041913]|uniref:hypothetical protein n=1 Tax=Actinosynnema sp. CS-041913 TaxID=3239917 RepID=UPI003D8B62DE